MNDIIMFEGFSWTNGQPKNLPVKNVAQKILCTIHNSLLSPLDSEAKRLFEVGAKFHNNQFERSKMKRSAVWPVDRAEFDGHELERLLAKIAVGVLQGEPETIWHLTGTSGMNPPKEIVAAIFGIRKFEPPMGMYFINVVGDTIVNEDRVTIHALQHPETRRFIGAIVSVRHWQFFINLSDLDPTQYSMESVTRKRIGLGGSPPTYRIQTINLNAGAKLSGRITINW